MGRQPTYHPDFTHGDVELILVKSETRFRIESSILRRTSGFFAAMFEDARPEGAGEHAPTTIDEDERTIEVLLKIASGVRFPRDLLATFDAVERLARAAEMYDVGAALSVAHDAAHRPAMRGSTLCLRRYALASHHGWDDVAEEAARDALHVVLDYDKVPDMDIRHFTRLLAFRQRRVDTFVALVNRACDPSLSAISRANERAFATKNDHCHFTWEALKRSMVLKLIQLPSGQTIFEDVRLVEALRLAKCYATGVTSYQVQAYDWEQLHAEILRCVAQLPTSLVPVPMPTVPMPTMPPL